MRLHTERDATVADFEHEVGHSCIHCQTIRELGPAQPQNTLARLMARAHGSTVIEVEPVRRSKSELRNEQRRADNQRRFLRAIQAA